MSDTTYRDARKSYKIRGIEPPDLKDFPTGVRKQYWEWVVEFGLKRKDKELSEGLDKDGKPLRPISAYTRKHRKSAMMPGGKGSPSAPPLTPGYAKSRTRSLLDGRALSTHAEFFWRFDSFTGDQWGAVLAFQAEQGRDVFGLSEDGTAWVQRMALERWEAYKSGHVAPVKEQTTKPAYVTPRGTKPLVKPTSGIGTEGETNVGYRTQEEWQAYWRKSAKVVIPGRPDTLFNRILKHVWGDSGKSIPQQVPIKVKPPKFVPVPQRAVVAKKPTPTLIPKPTSALLAIKQFARDVLRAAYAAPRFRDTNKVWIIDAYYQYVQDNIDVSLEEFKERLVEANQARVITLSRSDMPGALTPVERVKEQASETRQLIATFHWIRLS